MRNIHFRQHLAQVFIIAVVVFLYWVPFIRQARATSNPVTLNCPTPCSGTITCQEGEGAGCSYGQCYCIAN